MFSEKEYIKAIGIISCYLNCDEMSTEEFNNSIVVINDLINEYFEIIEEKERLEKAIDKACEELVEKETPKKPIYKRDKNRYVCGNCEERFPYTRDGIDQYIFPYCPYCGQRADWNEQE